MMEKPPQGSAEPKPIMMDKKILWAVQDDMAARLYTVGQISVIYPNGASGKHTGFLEAFLLTHASWC